MVPKFHMANTSDLISSHLYLEYIDRVVKACKTCNLCTTRTQAVSGEGNPVAKLMFVGEAPGQDEDLQGRPFIGRAGKLLNEALHEAGIERKNVFITNLVKCRPPENRNPSPAESSACAPYLSNQIKEISPALIVTLGKISAEYLLKRPVKITKENGRMDYTPAGLFIMTVFHPAYVLRNQRPEIRESFFQAIQDARNIAYGISNIGLYAGSS